MYHFAGHYTLWFVLVASYHRVHVYVLKEIPVTNLTHAYQNQFSGLRSGKLASTKLAKIPNIEKLLETQTNFQVVLVKSTG